VIAICFKRIDAEAITKDLEADMVFAGFILFTDPVKPNIIETIRELDKLKVGLKIITGDNPVVARSIARQLGIANPVVMTGTELAALNPEALAHRMKHTHIFSGVEPHQKERIILALKKNYTVAYMGDGISDQCG
jgi:Mg2+-importing ATPase